MKNAGRFARSENSYGPPWLHHRQCAGPWRSTRSKRETPSVQYEQPKSTPTAGVDHGFLSEPMQVGAFRICNECGKWFAFEVVRVEADATYGEIKHCRCKKCGSEISFAARHPHHTV